MLISNAYERMGVEKIPKAIAAKPIISFMVETLEHMPAEDESFVYEGVEFTVETVADGRVTEVIIHILDEEDIARREQAESAEEVTV